MAEMTCKQCGKNDDPESFFDGVESRIMKADGLCFICACWEGRARVPQETVIDGKLYGVGTKTRPHAFNGFGGQWFDIEYKDGRRVRTCDLWFGGEIPEPYQERIPNTARFVEQPPSASKAEGA